MAAGAVLPVPVSACNILSVPILFHDCSAACGLFCICLLNGSEKYLPSVFVLKHCSHVKQVSDSQGRAEDVYGPDSFAQLLVKAGSSPDAIEPESGELRRRLFVYVCVVVLCLCFFMFCICCLSQS